MSKESFIPFQSTTMVSVGKEHYVHDGNQRALVLDDDGDLQNRYLWGPGVDQLLADEVFDSSGQLVSRTHTDATIGPARLELHPAKNLSRIPTSA